MRSSPTSSCARSGRCRALEEASGSILDLNSSANTAHLIDTEGEIVTGNGKPTFGLGVDAAADRFNPLTIVEGEFADEPGEVVVDASSADRLGYHVGSPISIEVGGPVHEFELVGVAKFGDVDTIGSATMAIFDVREAQRLLGRRTATTRSPSPAGTASPPSG